MKTIQLKLDEKTISFNTMRELVIYAVNQIVPNDIEEYLENKYSKMSSKKWKSADEMFKAAGI